MVYVRKSGLCRAHYLRERLQHQGRTGRCQIDGCELPLYVRKHGLCRVHYSRYKTKGDALAPALRLYRYPEGTVCAAPDCDRTKIEAEGLCHTHYKALQYERDPERYRRNSRNSRQRHAAEVNARDRERYKIDPSTAKHANRRRKARIRGAKGSHTKAEWLARLAEYGGKCAYCDQPGTTLDHVIPIVRGGSDSIDNIVPACMSCNASKGDKLVEEWRGGKVRPRRPRSVRVKPKV